MDAKKSTKGQVQITETLLVLFAITIIIILGVFLFYRYNIQSLSEKGESLDEQQASVLLARISSMPEFECSLDNCMDASKFLPFENLARLRDYSGIFGRKRIVVEQVYPEASADKECTAQIYNQVDYPDNCNRWTLYNNAGDETYIISTPVALYFPETEEYRLGILKAEVSR